LTYANLENEIMNVPRPDTPKILIVHAGERLIFARRDRDILNQRYPTETFGFTGISQLPQLRRKMNAADIVIFWFVGRAAYYAMLPPPRKPRIVSLVGGYESARMPEFNYGSAVSWWRRRMIKYIFARSRRIIAVSEYTRSELNDNYGILPVDVTVIHNAVDTEYFIPRPVAQVNNVVFTVAKVDRILIRKKGFDLLAKTAQKLPDVRFVIAGGLADKTAKEFAEAAPRNVDFIGKISQGELLGRLQSAPVYFQPSRHESFGVAVIEAMSCGCVPVVSPYGALPEVVGDAGYILKQLDPDHAAEILGRAMRAPNEAHDRARARVVDCFDTRLRAEKLYRLIDELMTP
jgi:glycosyltransferase involved in cell wall biosynthesis